MKSNTQSVTLAAPVDHVFDFLAEPENLPCWAVGFCRAIRRQNGRWLVTTAQGEVAIRYVTNRALGTVDFHISLAPGVETVAFSRVLPNGAGAEYVFTQFQAPGMPGEVYDANVVALAAKLHVLPLVLRAGAACLD